MEMDLLTKLAGHMGTVKVVLWSPLDLLNLLLGLLRHLLVLKRCKSSDAEKLKKTYDNNKGQPYVVVKQGAADSILLLDPTIIKRVCIMDFRYFHSRGLPKNERASPLSAHLFSLDDDRWRSIRSVVSPAFTISKVKGMLAGIAESCEHLQRVLVSGASQSHGVLDMQHIMERYATDVAGRCCFGTRCTSLLEAPVDPFWQSCKSAFGPSWWRNMREHLIKWVPKVAVLLPHRQEITTFFQNTVQALKDERRAQTTQGSTKSDLLGLMLEAEAAETQPQKKEELCRTIPAQMFATFRAGFEATAPTLTFCLLELACNQEVQQRLQSEVDNVNREYGDQLNAEAMKSLKYMDMVLKETLRKYPPNAVLTRICTRDRDMADVPLKMRQGDRIVVSAFALHRDAQFYPDPERFDPERFNPDAEKRLRSLNVYLPFGSGLRRCPAEGFAMTQMKAALWAVLSEFRFERCSRTRMPVEFLPGRRFVIAAAHGCHLRVARR